MSAFGYLGRLLNATHLVGYPMCYFHSLTILMNEKKRTLAPVTNLNQMFDNLPNRSRTETKYLTFNLTLLSYLPFLHLIGTIPIMILKGFGAIMSFDCIWFFLLYTPLRLTDFLCFYVIRVPIFAAAHLLIVQSSLYLILRLKGVDKNLLHVMSNVMNTFQSTRINSILLDLEKKTFNEVCDHNQCIKQWLKQTTTLGGAMTSFIFISAVGSNEGWYETTVSLALIIFVSLYLSFSLVHAVYLFIKIRSTAILLYYLQEWKPIFWSLVIQFN